MATATPTPVPDPTEYRVSVPGPDPTEYKVGVPPEEKAGEVGAKVGTEAAHVRRAERAPWIRAALLGSQDGLVSVASLMIGVDAVSNSSSTMVISGLAGLVAGACSMAIGEFVSVHSQRDIEEAAIKKHRALLQTGPEAVAGELDTLTEAYVEKGLSAPLARKVAEELFAKDPVGFLVREELGIDEDDLAQPLQAAGASAISFVIGAIVPLLSAAFITQGWVRSLVVVLASSVMFVVFGFVGARLGGAPKLKSVLRTLFGGLAAIGLTYGILKAFAAAGFEASL